MNRTTRETRRDHWRQLTNEQEASGKSVRTFCREKDISEFSFYSWRRRLRSEQPVIFALVDTTGSAASTMIELVLTSGDRLRIPGDAATLRMVLNVVRERA
jgi:transposase-like protein